MGLGGLLELVRSLPDGAPIAEGEDGSLWEVIIEASEVGFRSARAYVDRHHSGKGS